MKFTHYFMYVLLSAFGVGVTSDIAGRANKIKRREAAGMHVKSVRPCPSRRGDTIKIGIFRNFAPQSAIDASNNAWGFDVLLACDIFVKKLGFNVEFFEVSLDDVGLCELENGTLDVIASSAVSITPAREARANFLITDNSGTQDKSLLINGAIASTACPCPACPASLHGIPTFQEVLQLIWDQILSNGAGSGTCPSFKQGTTPVILTTAAGTVQSEDLRNAFLCSLANSPFKACSCNANTQALQDFFNAVTVDVSTLDCDVLVNSLNAGTFNGNPIISAYIAPRGDSTQSNALLNALKNLNPNTQYFVCTVSTPTSIVQGWSFRKECCQLIVDAQAALNAVICQGQYADFVNQARGDLRNTQSSFCISAGFGTAYQLQPALSQSIAAGTIPQNCVCSFMPKKIHCDRNCLCNTQIQNPGSVLDCGASAIQFCSQTIACPTPTDICQGTCINGTCS